jgi:hypothetical protein
VRKTTGNYRARVETYREAQCADMRHVPRSLSESTRGRDMAEMRPFECVRTQCFCGARVLRAVKQLCQPRIAASMWPRNMTVCVQRGVRFSQLSQLAVPPPDTGTAGAAAAGAATVSGNGSQSSRPRSGNCVQAVIDLLQKEVGFVSKLERAPRAVHIKHRAKA